MSDQTYTPNTEPPQRSRRSSKIWIPILVLALIAVFLVLSANPEILPKDIILPTPPLARTPLEALLYEQLPELIRSAEGDNWTVEDLQFNEAGSQALLWLAENDPESGVILAREPQIVLALWDDTIKSWTLHLTSDADFADTFLSTDFKDDEIAGHFTSNADPKTGPGAAVYGGYKLPWAGGLTKRLTWSVGHSSCTPKYYCTNAYDFADGTMFEVTAAKGGYVYHWRDTCRNGNPGCTNSITLEDRTTTPWTYQIYMHLAYNSIPANLKQEGVFVSQAQLIGRADDTGLSSGHHLHFMVVEQSTLDSCRNYCFGYAVPITFLDVEINWDPGTQGGRPRLESEARWYGGTGKTNYLSGNYPSNKIWRFYFPFMMKR